MFVGGIARWDGTAWSPLTGSLGTGIIGRASAMGVYDDDAGPALYVGGEFALVGGGLEARNVARWDGTDWSSLSGPAGEGVAGRSVDAMVVFDDGEPALYLGGSFGVAGGVASWNVARWLCTNRIFGDGFETGDLSAWSGSIGGP